MITLFEAQIIGRIKLFDFISRKYTKKTDSKKRNIFYLLIKKISEVKITFILIKEKKEKIRIIGRYIKTKVKVFIKEVNNWFHENGSLISFGSILFSHHYLSYCWQVAKRT